MDVEEVGSRGHVAEIEGVVCAEGRLDDGGEGREGGGCGWWESGWIGKGGRGGD